MSTTATHWIDGARYDGDGPDELPILNPASGTSTGRLRLAASADVEAVVSAAVAAFPAWRDTSLARRTSVLFAFRELLNKRKDQVAEIITREHGKVLSDALGEVARGQEVVEFACGAPHLLKGSATVNASTRVDVQSIRQPVGPVAVIAPFNFPAMVPMWFVPLALAAGNSVILKPSEKAPSASLWMAELWKEAELPDGVFNVLQGDKLAVDGLLDHPAIRAVSFVGSTPVARYVYERGTAAGKRVQALGGAKNHMVVLPDADLDSAADAAIGAGFGSAGQRCMAVSVVVTVGDIADEFTAKLKQRMAKLVVGEGTSDSDMGPVISAESRDRATGYIEAGLAQGASLEVDGRTVSPKGDPGGYWLGPTLFDHVTPEMTIYQDEIFAPVLAIVRVDTYEEAVRIINDNPYGNGVAVFTNNGGAARRFQTEIEVGMVGVNVPIPVPMAYYSFGGWKASLFGDTHAHGMDGIHFFTRQKTVTARWLDPSEQHGVDLGFPRAQ
ncbi:CoA-acylating methylmalonate-semialdehyde dehydrogenase [Amycolatopsis panacis]|uniref:methylmalonate-semialdehyde dehydrogenase (CoA acylating) n=1 Tax=Amycolatopsis panacis TaxID=2340917 RepID=A0A419HZK9_9PSEU|nr:CoA-acylating methylmalonate-semialdehyde dehydrogenase [Amycolatopsis panacis]RJQ82666.1 CoA-acylating methylmalonate-semialdehyde dehydrogenase [Amycolatopsis panacis]